MSRPATASKKSGRPAVLGPAVADRLREAIVTGRWLPGTRLPTRRELGATFDCSTITLQMAMDMLASERFIRSDGRHGTFVAERPPHLTDIAVVFPPSPVASNHFWVAVDNTVKHATFGDHALSSWYEVNGHGDNPAYCALCERVRQGSLAGLLFVTSPFAFVKSPLLLARPAPLAATVVDGVLRIQGEGVDDTLFLFRDPVRAACGDVRFAGRYGAVLKRPQHNTLVLLDGETIACGAAAQESIGEKRISQ